MLIVCGRSCGLYQKSKMNRETKNAVNTDAPTNATSYSVGATIGSSTVVLATTWRASAELSTAAIWSPTTSRARAVGSCETRPSARSSVLTSGDRSAAKRSQARYRFHGRSLASEGPSL